MIRLALFCSGSGSNAARIMDHCAGQPDLTAALLLANRPDAYALTRARERGVPTCAFSRDDLYTNGRVLATLRTYQIDLLVLAGFLWRVPPPLLDAYPERVVNVHPALLPRHGGAGMYGMHVHRAVVAAGDRETGITIHLANARYDEGATLFQARCPVYATDTPEVVSERVLALEHAHFPEVLADYARRVGPLSPPA